MFTVRFIIKRGFKSRVGCNGACTVTKLRVALDSPVILRTPTDVGEKDFKSSFDFLYIKAFQSFDEIKLSLILTYAVTKYKQFNNATSCQGRKSVIALHLHVST